MLRLLINVQHRGEKFQSRQRDLGRKKTPHGEEAQWGMVKQILKNSPFAGTISGHLYHNMKPQKLQDCSKWQAYGKLPSEALRGHGRFS